MMDRAAMSFGETLSVGESWLMLIDPAAASMAVVLAGLCALGAVAGLPLVLAMLALNPALAEEMKRKMPPLPLVALQAAVKGLVLFGVTAYVGLLAARQAGAPLPLVLTLPQPVPLPDAQLTQEWVDIASLALPVGLAAGAFVALADWLLFRRILPEPLTRIRTIPLWKRLLGGMLYGAINEEVLMRLFGVSAIALLLGQFWRGPEGLPAPGAWWTAIVAAALLFGLSHLPLLHRVAGMTPALAARTIGLNGALGIVFGLLYYRLGLEAAVLGHLAAHLPLQTVPGPSRP